MKNSKMFKSILLIFMLVVLCAPMVVQATVYQGAKLDASISLPKYSYQSEGSGKIQIMGYGYDESSMPQMKYIILDSNRNVVDTLILNSDGYASSKNLPLGKYYVQEFIAGEYYREFEAEIIKDGSIITQMLNLGNGNRQQGKIVINVLEFNESISPVKYEILDSDKNVVDTLVIDRIGDIESIDLPFGTYYLKEIVPEGMNISNGEEEVILIPANPIYSIVVNYKTPIVSKGKLVLTVKNELNEPVKNAEYNVLNSNNEVIFTLVTNENGIVQKTGLPYGKYYIQETGKVEGYANDSTIYEVDVDANNSGVLELIKYFKVVVPPAVSPRIVYKDQNENSIDSAIVEIYHENQLIFNSITDNNGICCFPNDILEYNKEYIVRIINNSNKYLYNTMEKKFTYTEENQYNLEIILKNYTSDYTFIKGDLDENGIVNANDAAIALDLYKYGNVTEHELNVGDMDNNGIINANDAALILDVYKYGN